MEQPVVEEEIEFVEPEPIIEDIEEVTIPFICSLGMTALFYWLYDFDFEK